MPLIPKDATGFEKFVYIFAELFCPALILFMVLSAFQVFHNDYSAVCKIASPHWLWKSLGIVFLLSSGGIFYAMKEDLLEATRGSLFFLIALLGLSFSSFAGFFS